MQVPCGLSSSFFEEDCSLFAWPEKQEEEQQEKHLLLGLKYLARRLLPLDEFESRRIADACQRAERGFRVLERESAGVNQTIRSLLFSFSLPMGLTRRLAPFIPPLLHTTDWKRRRVCIYDVFKALLKETHELRFAVNNNNNHNNNNVSVEYSRAVDLLTFMEGQREMKKTIEAHIAIEAACALVEAKEFFHTHALHAEGCHYRMTWASSSSLH